MGTDQQPQGGSDSRGEHLRICEPHGLRYDPRVHDGCVLCRRGPPRTNRWRSTALIGAGCLVVVAGGFAWLQRSPAGAAKMVAALRPASVVAIPPEPMPTLVKLPSGKAPVGGWPTVVALHGAGSSSKRSEGLADGFMPHGFAVLLPTAPRRLSGAERYAWPDFATTAAYVNRVVERERKQAALAACPLLAGFSQGASRALELAARDESRYCGVLAVSPMGAVLGTDSFGSRPVPAVVIMGRRDAPALATLKRIQSAWEDAGWPVLVLMHEGGHQAPRDWPEFLSRALSFLMKPRG